MDQQNNKRRIKLIISYDGTNFSGWQSQPKDRTIQDELEKSLFTLIGENVRIIGAGRTDAGVHATGQVAHFDTVHPSIPDCKFCEALNSLLPPDIRILESVGVPDDFHARYSALRRTYRYYIDPSSLPRAHLRLYSWQIRKPLSIERLNTFSRLVTGTHDFTSFARLKDPSNNKVKTVTTSCFYMQNGMIVYEISSQSFLWMMVRTIVGTIVECVQSGQTEKDFMDILDAQNRDEAGTTAPAQGLFLERIYYE